MLKRVTSPLRVLQVTPRYFPLAGGVENHVYEVSRRLARDGVEVTVLTTDSSGRLAACEEIDGVRIQRVRAWPARRDYYVAPGIVPFIRSNAWDVIHIQSYHTAVAPLAMLAAAQAHIPFVVTFHGGGHSSRLRNKLRGFQRSLLRPLLARAARLIAVASFEVELYAAELHMPASRFTVIPNGADLPQPIHAAAVSDGLLIASIGRLESYKGHQRILAAMPAILSQEPTARLWIAGVGPYQATLQRQAQQLGVADWVEIRAIPPAERATMAAELSQTALVVLLSEYETHPIAALEALALGRPLLVADTSGLSELARRGWARAIPLGSTPRQVADAVVDQLRRPSPPISVELPTWEQCASRLLGLYRAVAGERACVS
jgi:glycosyltransferase involved in cell wall biosynthesis